MNLFLKKSSPFILINTFFWDSEYLKFQDCNFISVDWEKLANAPNYHRAVNDVKLVGEATGDLITFLNKFGTAQEKFHLVGFSLGSHVVGKAASSVAFDITRVTGSSF